MERVTAGEMVLMSMNPSLFSAFGSAILSKNDLFHIGESVTMVITTVLPHALLGG